MIQILIVVAFTVSGFYLNRIRGTGDVITYKDHKVSGMFIYAIAIGALTYFLSGEWYYGLLGIGLFILGESCTWGNGIKCLREKNPTEEKLNSWKESDRGKSFPWLYYPANYIVRRDDDVVAYSIVFLQFRAIYWWAPLLCLWVCTSSITVISAVLAQLVLCCAWPPICTASRDHALQEKLYGAAQGLTIGLMVGSSLP